MNTTKTKPTPGPCSFPTEHASHMTDPSGRYIMDVPMPNWMTLEEWTGNKALVSESFTVYHETGLTPRQLLDQRNALWDALESIAHYPIFLGPGFAGPSIAPDHMTEVKASISKVMREGRNAEKEGDAPA